MTHTQSLGHAAEEKCDSAQIVSIKPYLLNDHFSRIPWSSMVRCGVVSTIVSDRVCKMFCSSLSWFFTTDRVADVKTATSTSNFRQWATCFAHGMQLWSFPLIERWFAKRWGFQLIERRSKVTPHTSLTSQFRARTSERKGLYRWNTDLWTDSLPIHSSVMMNTYAALDVCWLDYFRQGNASWLDRLDLGHFSQFRLGFLLVKLSTCVSFLDVNGINSHE